MTFLLLLRQEVSGLWGGGKGISLVAVAVGWGLLNGTRMIYPVIIPHLETAYGLSLAVSGLLVTVLWFFAAIGQLPGGMLADRYSERKLMAVGAAIVALSLGIIVTSSSALVLFVATALWGLGHSLYPIARITFLSNLYPGRLGSALGVTMATGDIGQTVLPPIATLLAAAIAWQAGLGFVAPLLLLAGLAVVATSSTKSARSRRLKEEQEAAETAARSDSDAASDGDSSTQSLSDLLSVFAELRRPAMGLMTGILFLYMFIWQSFTAFYPTYLTRIKDLSPTTASVLFGFFFAVGVLVKPAAGAAYDRIGMRIALISILTPAVAGFLLLPFVDSVWLLVVITALISTMLGTGAVTQSYLADSFSKEMQGSGLGVVRTVSASLAATGPVIFGVIGDYGYFDQGYIALAVIMAVVIALTFWMPGTATSETQ
ncbi:major facilitator superfamily transport protein (plasmid) [Natrialba magadii ATCC 43099]|nr:MFS transporter [Natrialba magadii]ADD07184.2 major facilitator superfamily transport protein [Natrialba magadii ATCC 43099]